jgi:hypothetical protein
MKGLLSPENNLGGLFNTKLSPADEAAFRLQPIGRQMDTWDYDPRAAFEGGGFAAYAENGHGGDYGKKPNHPTFSEESKYSTEGFPGGRWAESSFIPSVPMYEDRQRMQGLLQYLKGPAEQGKVLMVPPYLAAPKGDFR